MRATTSITRLFPNPESRVRPQYGCVREYKAQERSAGGGRSRALSPHESPVPSFRSLDRYQLRSLLSECYRDSSSFSERFNMDEQDAQDWGGRPNPMFTW